MYTLSGNAVPGTTFSLGSQAIPGILGMNVVMPGMMGIAAALTMEREDGTLLRMKAIPNGMVGYLVGKVVSQAGMTAAMLLIVLIPSSFLFDGLELWTARRPGWPWPGCWRSAWSPRSRSAPSSGRCSRAPQSLGFIMLPIMGLVGISGIFYPITALPVWLQWIAQALPDLLARPRDALGAAAGRAGGRRDRGLLAAPGDGRRPGGLGDRRAGRRADRAAADGAARSPAPARVRPAPDPAAADASRRPS